MLCTQQSGLKKKVCLSATVYLVLPVRKNAAKRSKVSVHSVPYQKSIKVHIIIYIVAKL